MITMSELLKGKDFNSLPPVHKLNLNLLLQDLNKLRAAYGKPIIVTSGYRSMEDHLRIYREKGITKIPMKSKHLTGDACDFSDPKGELKKFILANMKLIEELDLYFEDFASTPNWVHVQIVPPQSKNRFFKP